MMENILEKVENYWDKRSEGYSEVNVAELNSYKMDVWKELINRHKPAVIGRKLRVLDIGTGPGFFAITMASCGYDVTAVDYTDAMLHKAKRNAQNYRNQIKFMQMDAHQLNFEDSCFDLIITRNLTWNLERPDDAYREWHRVLAPGGKMLNFDANWYLHLYDEEKREAYFKDRVNSEVEGVNDHYVRTDTTAMEEIAKNLPLSRTMRPQWDAAVLINTGFKKVMVEQGIGELVWDKEEQVNYASTPMFMISAEK
ncbi:MULTISPECIES: class I SAM-dependent methyltransferase [unclassified Acetobacterium]|jgi:ubiquinone/menaquinone biosynthesis C-methylase UbiE|uniref:class I SAM-dependent methyltransferase n=1 Tax=unclassified Acetobacterium TaxID=2638182 RepID=UPI00267E6B3C|nr:methyltransferase domain-containing protein [Acetobacterium sp. K1/6]MDZ5725462.1 methyltransferase domain-containing protein [Acetobacterium sp. K1/6]